MIHALYPPVLATRMKAVDAGRAGCRVDFAFGADAGVLQADVWKRSATQPKIDPRKKAQITSTARP